MKTKRINYQKRDLALLSKIGKVVVVDDEMIQEEYFADNTTGDARARRIRMLMADGRIRRLRFSEISLTVESPRVLSIYRLTRGGAELLVQAGMPPQRLLRNDPRPETLLHRRDLARVMLALDNAVWRAGLPEPEWILEQDLCPGAARNVQLPRAERFVLSEDFKVADGKILKLRPDASSWLRFPHNGGWHDLLAYLEIDRASERLTQVADKLPPYDFLLRKTEPGADGKPLYRRH